MFGVQKAEREMKYRLYYQRVLKERLTALRKVRGGVFGVLLYRARVDGLFCLSTTFVILAVTLPTVNPFHNLGVEGRLVCPLPPVFVHSLSFFASFHVKLHTNG